MSSARKIYFYRQLSALLESGVSILRALELLAEQERSKLGRLLHDLHKFIESGLTLTQAVSLRKNFFSDFEIAIIHCGELTGNLETNLQSIVEYLETTQKRTQRFLIGILYPIILLHVVILLPPIKTLILEGSIPYLRAVFPGLVCLYLVFLFIIGLLKIIRRSASASTLCARVLWSIPIIGGIIKKLGISRFTASLGLSLRAGLNAETALRISSQASASAAIKLKIAESERFLSEEGIAGVLEKTAVFPNTVIEMAVTGERSGKLDEMLLRTASSLESEANSAINKLLVVLPVIIYLVVAIYMAYIIISSYLDYFGNIFPW